MSAGSLGRKTKDPSDVRIYGIEWSRFLSARDDATISSSTYAVESGVTKVSQSTSGSRTFVKVSGGTAGEEYLVTNTVTLSNGETVEKSFRLQVREQ